jgi:putative transposase
MSVLMRYLKGFTSRKIMKTIQDNPQESRREWMLWMFERAGKKNNYSNNDQTVLEIDLN